MKASKQQAQLMPIAGTLENGKSLYAILDEYGYTEYQLWHHEGYIKSNYQLIT